MQIITINSWSVLILGLVATAATLYGSWYVLLKDYSSEGIFDFEEFFEALPVHF